MRYGVAKKPSNFRDAVTVGASEGAAFRAVVEITTKGKTVVAAVGETCERVDPAALAWLERCGAIERIAKPEGPDGG